MDLFNVSKHSYIELCKEAQWHNYLYFVKNEPVLDDSSFDALIEKIRRIEELHPDWIIEESPIKKLAETTTPGFKQVPHRSPMLSLEKAFTLEHLHRFEKRIRQEVPKPVFCVEYKMDGCALSIWYEKGKFVKAVTRGNGVYGDDVTENIKALRILPECLQGPVPDFIELRAEVYMSFASLEKLNARREQKGLDPLANTRNAAAGSLKLLDSKEVATRGLEIAIYSAHDDPIKELIDLRLSWDFIQNQQLPSVSYHRFVETISQVEAYLQEVQEKRSALPFAIDGIVVKLSDVKQAQRLGATGQYYRWGIAYKFSPQSATTQLLDITLQVGRTGVMTPVATLKPVFLDGSLVSRCTLHNSDEIARKDIRIGDWVVIAKGGDVIPKVLQVEMAKRQSDLPVWNMPKVCPACQTPLIREKGEVAWKCLNSHECPAQILRRLIYFVSKDGFDIEGLGIRTLEQLVDKSMVACAADLFKLTPQDFLGLDGFAQLSAQKLYESIQARKSVSLDRFIAALNIKHLGVSMAEQLAKSFASLPALMQATVEDLDRLDGIGLKAAKAIWSAFQVGHSVRKTLDGLLTAGVNPYWHAKATQAGHLFNHKKFVLTGTLAEFTRSNAAKLIKERGGSVLATVNAKTDYLVVGTEAGSKLEKAQKHNVKILNEAQFKSLL